MPLAPQHEAVGRDAVAPAAEGHHLRRERRVAGAPEAVVEGGEVGELGADGKEAGALFLRNRFVTGGVLVGGLRVDGREGAQAQEQKTREKEPKKGRRS